MAGTRAILLMQTSGFATLANQLASLSVPFQIPTMTIVSERGTLGAFNVGQMLVARTLRPVLDYLAIENHTITRLDEVALIFDRSILMQLGALGTVAARAQKNPIVVILDNGAYQITGGQKTLTDQGVVIVAVARGSGLTQSAWAADESAFEEMIDRALKEDGPWLIGCRVDNNKPVNTTERDLSRIRDQFMRGLGAKK